MTLLMTTFAATALTGCSVFGVDRAAARREAAAEAAYPPTGPLLEVDGRTVHAHVEGSGPDVVLIHGASGNTRDFTFDLVGALAPEFRVIAFDRPGLGWSDDMGAAGTSPSAQAAALRAAAAQLDVRDPVVLGHSYGAAVALAWALQDRDGPRGLVLVSGATMPWPGGLGPWYDIAGSRLGGATVVPLISATVGAERAGAAVRAIFAPEDPPAGYLDHVGAGLSLRRDSLRANARQVNALKPWVTAAVESYPSLTLPVELLHGSADRIVPIEIHSEKLARLLPDARLTRLAGAGHMPHHTRTGAVVDAVRQVAARR